MTPDELAAIKACVQAALDHLHGELEDFDMAEYHDLTVDSARDVPALLALIECDWEGLDALIDASPTLREYLDATRGNVEALAAKVAAVEALITGKGACLCVKESALRAALDGEVRYAGSPGEAADRAALDGGGGHA